MKRVPVKGLGKEQNFIRIAGTRSGIRRLAAEQIALKGDKVYVSRRDIQRRNKEVANELKAISESNSVVGINVGKTEKFRLAVFNGQLRFFFNSQVAFSLKRGTFGQEFWILSTHFPGKQIIFYTVV